MRREPLLAAGLFDVKFRRLQDWELWVRLLRQGHLFAGLAEGLIDYRLHDSSLSTDPSGGQEAAMAMVVKHFGIDDGRPEGWPTEKRRAYGGVYRYHGVTASLLRAGDWQACGRYLRQAFQADPSLAEDLDLFYELALGVQPLGQRGLSGKLRLADNAAKIKALLEAIYQPPLNAEMAGHRARAFNMAYHALGLVAYNTGCDQLTARFLLIALRFRPSLPQLKRSGSLLLKTFLLRPAIRMVRSVKSAPQFGSQKPETQER
jgi:hypothetical protein